jgi:hypothetical protein
MSIYVLRRLADPETGILERFKGDGVGGDAGRWSYRLRADWREQYQQMLIKAVSP